MRRSTADDNYSTGFVRALVGGEVNSGKTHFGSTWPAPVFIADASEGGSRTLRVMAQYPETRALWWDPKVPPEIWEIENAMEAPQLITKLLEWKGTLPFRSLIFDTLSIFSRRAVREQRAANPSADGRQWYGEMYAGVDALVVRAHALPMHVCWLCHTDSDMQLTFQGRAMGSMWAYMQHKWLLHVDLSVMPNGQPEYQLHHKPWQRANWLGSKDYIAAPSPMCPSFKPMAELLGLAERPVSLACPDFEGYSWPEGISYVTPAE